MSNPDTTWRYGMYVAEFGKHGGTAQGFTPEGCRNMLGHQMEQMHHASEVCTCGQYPKDRLRRPTDPKRWCDACKALQAARDLLQTEDEVHYLDRVWYYREEPADERPWRR
uniref:hypothetical protein n=1 Tax=Nonomuraea sp. CA-251285 TaxID=3240002 RepID=UPI003F4963D5